MITTTDRKIQYDIAYPFGTDFVIDFKFWAAGQIHAVLSFAAAADEELTISTDYTLTAPGDSGTLTKVSDWNHDAIRLTIYREMDMEQATDYRNGETVDLDILEQDFDYSAARDQQIVESVERTMTVPITDPVADNELPAAGERANTFLAFDADGAPIAAAGMASVPVTPFMETVLDDTTADAAQTTLGVSTFIKTLLDDADAAEARATLDAAQGTTLGKGTFTPVAGYTPAAGDVIELIHDGKIRKASQVAWTQIEASQTFTKIRLCELDETRFVVMYAYGLNLKAKVGTVNLNDLSITYGAEATVATVSGYAGYCGIVPLTSNLVLVGITQSALGQLSVVTLSISGTTITVNTPVNGVAAATIIHFCKYDSSKGVLFWTTNGTTNVTAAVISVSGTTPTINASSAVTLGAACSLKGMGSVSVDGAMCGIGVGSTATTPFPSYVCQWTLSGTTVSSPTAVGVWPWGITAASNSGELMFLQQYSAIARTGWAPDAAITKRIAFCLYCFRRGGDTLYDPPTPMPIIEIPYTSSDAIYMKAVDPENGIVIMFWTTYNVPAGTSLVNRFHIVKHRPVNALVFDWGDEIDFDFSYASTNPCPGDAIMLSGGTVVVALGVAGVGYNKVGAIRRRNKVIGIAIDAAGTVQFTGVFTTTGLTVGAKYYLDSTGALSTTEGECAIGIAQSATELLLNIQPGI
jgi:hypothetical protein